uniref:RNA helicase n=1 Tax=Entomoneis paludosa TaxID=265537 RepID=A0A7S3DMB8_9STRA
MVAPQSDKTGNYGGGKKKSAGSFQALGLSPEVFQGIVKMGYQQPTPVQRQALPVLLTGVDAVVMARTGSGKTAAFIVPLLEKLIQERQQEASAGSFQRKPGVRGVILSPTRELSLQTLKVLQKMGSQTEFRFIGIHGSEGMEKQFALLASQPDVIVATPGRLAHHLTEIPDFTLNACTTLILDEADRLLEMGLAQQIRQIAKSVAPTSQKILLSATLPKVLVEFTQQHNNLNIDDNLSVVRLDQDATVSADLRMAFLTCRSMEKDAALLHLLHYVYQQQSNDKRGGNGSGKTGLTLIFAATRHHVEYIANLIASAPEFAAKNMEPTVIYGSLDSEARRANLNAFRMGEKPILVVTDVAARGVDVPLIDHVIHYHFPPSPKLFVHRSGRAARAGRIGYGWALVDPEEMPYMMDLHLFLGRKPTTSIQNASEQDPKETTVSYSLNEMTPETVHFGSIPESVMTSETEEAHRLVSNMKPLARVCENAMKQYRRTRPLASKSAVHRAKEILDGKRTSSTGSHMAVVGGGSIPIHPLFVRELETNTAALSATSPNALNSRQNVQQREEFLRALSQFRPKESVFEAFATGGGKQVGVVSQVDKGRTNSDSKKKGDSSAALTAMKNMRRQMRMARDKALVVAGSDTALAQEEALLEAAQQEVHSTSHGEESSQVVEESGIKKSADPTPVAAPAPGKRRMSKAERKKAKKGGSTFNDTALGNSKKKKDMRASDFRDQAYFIENDFTSNSEEAQRSRQIEAAMQPSSSSVGGGGGGGGGHSLMGAAMRMEEAMLDIVGDENDELVKRQRMMRWDKSKRKYVQTTVGDELSGDSKSKRLRLESGQLVNSKKLTMGQLYEKWQKKTNKSIGRNGVFDDVVEGSGAVSEPVPTKKGDASKKSQTRGTNGPAEGMKTAEQIRKERAKKQDNKLKNMKRSERKSVEQRKRTSQSSNKNKSVNVNEEKTKAALNAKKRSRR